MKRIYRFPITQKRFHRGRSGQSLVEFAMVSMLFFLLVFGLIDFGHVFFSQMTLQHALREAGRFAVTGRHLTDPNNNTITLSRYDSIKAVAKQAATGTDIQNMSISYSSAANGPYVNDGINAGGPSGFVKVSLTANVQLFTPLVGQFFGPSGVYTFTVNTTFRSEPFNPKDA